MSLEDPCSSWPPPGRVRRVVEGHPCRRRVPSLPTVQLSSSPMLSPIPTQSMWCVRGVLL